MVRAGADANSHAPSPVRDRHEPPRHQTTSRLVVEIGLSGWVNVDLDSGVAAEGWNHEDLADEVGVELVEILRRHPIRDVVRESPTT
jgi:hypothetical protein